MKEPEVTLSIGMYNDLENTFEEYAKLSKELCAMLESQIAFNDKFPVQFTDEEIQSEEFKSYAEKWNSIVKRYWQTKERTIMGTQEIKKAS